MAAVPEIRLFHIMWNGAISETELIREVVSQLQAVLPASWQFHEARLELRTGDAEQRVGDAWLELRSSDGGTSLILLEVKLHLDPIHVPRLLQYLRKAGDAVSILVAAPYLSPRTRQLLVEGGANYLDLTGNVRLRLEQPAVFIQLAGAQENPANETRPLASLKGNAAARVVRAVCDHLPPYGVRELAQRAEASLASTSRVAELLSREALLQKDPRGRITAVDWPTVLERWSEDYHVLKSHRSVTALEPRGIAALPAKLKTLALRYAVTGSLAAVRMAPAAPARLAMVFVEDIKAALVALELHPTDAGQNVILLEPSNGFVFAGATSIDGVVCAAPSQVAADLLTSPGRGPEEAKVLIEWMKEHEPAWRH